MSKRIWGLSLFIIILAGTLASSAWSSQDFRKKPSSQPPKALLAMVSNEVLVKFHPVFERINRQRFQNQVQAASVTNREQAMAAFHRHFKTRSRRSLLGWETVVLPAGVTVEQAMQDFSQNELVEKVQPNGLVHGAAPLSTSYNALGMGINDTYYNNGVSEWWLNRIKGDLAYKNRGSLGLGSSVITVAVVDTGVNIGHAEFSSPVRLQTGYNVIAPASPPEDDNLWEGAEYIQGHGTHVAGIIIANLNFSGIAGAGFASTIQVLPVKVLDANNSGSVDNVAAGIVWAANNGANIINMSFGIYANFDMLQNACEYASNSKNCFLVAAGGNDNIDINYYPYYPACYPKVMAVAATNSMDIVTSYSNVGYNHLTYTAVGGFCAAPGGELYQVAQGSYTFYPDYGVTSTAMAGSWSAAQGTSFAAPQVAALAALLKEQNPARTNIEIANIIKGTSEMPGGMNSYYLGAGRINVYNALTFKSATPTTTFSATPTITRTATRTPSATLTRTVTPTPSGTATPTFSATATATLTGTKTPTSTATPTLSPTPSVTLTGTVTQSSTPTPTLSATPSVTLTGTVTQTTTATPTLTPTPSITLTGTITPTTTGTPTTSPTFTITPTYTPTGTFSATPSISATRTISATATASSSPTPMATITSTPSATATWHGIQDLEGDTLIVFPNPARKTATLAFITAGTGQAEFRVYNSAYLLVTKFTRDLSVPGPHLEPWSVADLAPGIYLCRLIVTGDDGRKKNYPITKLMILK